MRYAFWKRWRICRQDEHEALLRVADSATELIQYMRDTRKDEDLSPSHDRLVRTLRGWILTLDSKFPGLRK